MKPASLLALAGACLAVSGVSCPWIERPDQKRDRAAVTLRHFSSEDELRSFLAEQARVSLAPPGGDDLPFFFGGFLPDVAPSPLGGASEEADAGADGAPGEAFAGDAFSTTNIQEVGVDESDVVKNDRRTIYVLEGDTIHVVRADPPESMAELTTVDVEPSGDSLYLYGHKLIALSRRYVYYLLEEPVAGVEEIGGPWNDGSQTAVTVFDVSDPSSPVLEATIKFEGQLATSRLIDNRLHLVLTTIPRLPDDPTPIALDEMTLDQWIPDFLLTDAGGNARSGDIVGWQDFYRPETPDGYSITTVVTLDLDAPAGDFQSTAVSANAGVIYASTEALYLTDVDYDWSSFNPRVDTAVHKLALTESGTDYLGSELVPGRPLNQYSLGEHQGYLRIATTVEDLGFNGGGSSNSVYVLGQSDGSLEIVGQVENIAPGEQIYAARFIGDRGFLVTFQRIDPLFTMDLSDPTRPQVLGELKVPGYSDHIQLLDQDHLLTIGKDAQDAGTFAWIQGVQLSIFDVSDMADPQLLHKEVIGGRGTDSEANHNPKAFNYFAAAHALAFPIDLYSATGQASTWGQHEFTGLYVYRVTVEGGFEFLGGIASTEETPDAGCCCGCYGFTRGVFIDDAVYCVTQNGAKAASLGDVGTVIGRTQFTGTTPPPDDCWYLEEPDLILPVGEGLR